MSDVPPSKPYLPVNLKCAFDTAAGKSAKKRTTVQIFLRQLRLKLQLEKVEQDVYLQTARLGELKNDPMTSDAMLELCVGGARMLFERTCDIRIELIRLESEITNSDATKEPKMQIKFNITSLNNALGVPPRVPNPFDKLNPTKRGASSSNGDDTKRICNTMRSDE